MKHTMGLNGLSIKRDVLDEYIFQNLVKSIPSRDFIALLESQDTFSKYKFNAKITIPNI